MKSRITIEVDFDNLNKPVIQILSRDSDDLRDGLIKAFYQSLQGSSWCKIVFKQDEHDYNYPENSFKRIYITPIPEYKLQEEASIMIEQARVRKEYELLQDTINRK